MGEVGGGLFQGGQQQLQHQGGPRVAALLPAPRLCRAGIQTNTAELVLVDLQACSTGVPLPSHYDIQLLPSPVRTCSAAGHTAGGSRCRCIVFQGHGGCQVEEGGLEAGRKAVLQ